MILILWSANPFVMFCLWGLHQGPKKFIPCNLIYHVFWCSFWGVCEEAGEQHVHPITRKVAKISKPMNAHRDLFRYINLPVPLSWVPCPVSEPGAEKTKEQLLPMYDPHELLQYLWETDRIRISAGLIEQLDYFSSRVVLKCVIFTFTSSNIVVVPFFDVSTSIRQYWKHWSAIHAWARDHPGNHDAFPVSMYGDEARFSQTHQDKFIALCLGSPMIFKQGFSFPKVHAFVGLFPPPTYICIVQKKYSPFFCGNIDTTRLMP